MSDLSRRTEQGAARLPGLDVMRGIAAAAVFLFHTQFLVGFDKRVLPPIHVSARTIALPNFVSLGASGVTLFFILSGLCLSMEPLRRARSLAPLPNVFSYFRNRFARIYPAYFVALVFSAVEVVWIEGESVHWAGGQLLVHALFLQGLSGECFISLNGALWSMATEVQFYVMFPALLWFLTRVGIGRFLLATIGFTVAYRFVIFHLPQASEARGSMTFAGLLGMQLPGRLGEFALGMALAGAHARGTIAPSRVWAALMAVLLPIAFFIRWRGPPPLAEIALGLAYAPALALVLNASRIPAHSPVLAWIVARSAEFGRSSYSFFLIHIPSSAVLMRYVHIPTEPSFINLARAIALLFPTSLLASTAMYRLIELPLWTRLRASRAQA
jgi:peptidoglycan/LPS O-acetylase OafA/YrhL